jgi:hypothetical protein
MFVKSTSVIAASCAILMLIVPQQSATAKQQYARKHHPAISQCYWPSSNAYAADPVYTLEEFGRARSLANGAMASGLAGH